MAQSKQGPRPRRIDGESPAQLELCNHTELMALAWFNEIPGASHAVSRTSLVEALRAMNVIDAEDPIASIRYRLSSWLRRYWERVRMQMRHKRCPDCSKSCDVQVIYCYLENKHQIT